MVKPNFNKNKHDLHCPSSNSFNEYFSSIGATLAESMGTVNLENVNLSMPIRNKYSLFLNPTSTDEIYREIKSSKGKYSTDFNDFNMYIIKQINNEISPLLTIIFNKSLSSGIFPNILKRSKVIPLYKSGDKSKTSNYRPISLLPQLSKILEKIIKSRLLTFINKYNIISDSQYGFRQNTSTGDAVSDLIENVTDHLEKLDNCAILSIDLRKAFDTLNHSILLDKLLTYGVRGPAHDILASYLSNRWQYVQLSDDMSSNREITCGVPQGSVLGPLLFILYINDLPNISQSFTPILFADDTTLIFNDKSTINLQNKIQSDVNKLCDWLYINKLSINIDKTNVLYFNIRNKNMNSNINIFISNKKIKSVNHIKFLGVFIDSKLNWYQQIKSVCTKLSYSIGMLNKVKNKLNTKSLILLYNSFIYSHLNYCSHIWGNTYLSNLNRIVILQNRAIKTITKSKFFINNFLISNKSLNFADIVKLNTIKFCFRARQKLLPINLQHKFQSNERYKNNFIRKKARTSRKLHTLSNIGPKLWNDLDQNIKDIKTANTLKHKYKLHLISKYVI